MQALTSLLPISIRNQVQSLPKYVIALSVLVAIVGLVTIALFPALAYACFSTLILSDFYLYHVVRKNNAQIQIANQSNTELSKIRNDLDSKLKRMDSVLSSQQAENRHLHIEITQLKSIRYDLEKAASDLTQQVSRLDEERSRFRLSHDQEINHLAENLDKLKTNNQKLQDAIAFLEKFPGEYEEKLKLHRAICNEIQEQSSILRQIKTELEKAEQDLRKTKEEFDSSRAELQTALHHFVSSTRTIEKTDAAVQALWE